MQERNLTLLFLITLLAILTLYPLIDTGFTNNDDMRTELTAYFRDWNSEIKLIQEGGRINRLIGWLLPLSVVPYLFDHPVYFQAFRLGAPMALLLTLGWLLHRLYRSFTLAALPAIFFLAFIQNNWEHNLLTSYPLTFNGLFTLFMLALISFTKALETKKLRYAILGSLLYFLTLSYEGFFLYGIVFFLLWWSYSAHSDQLVPTRFKIFLLSVIGIFIGYLSIYLAWRYLYPPSIEQYG
ncbi:MAG: hypothetical protein LM522_11910, partial [Candidatus Contendobacter sp.]|nr:hypothetical protein [Candidatus Contendobacter sp.]